MNMDNLNLKSLLQVALIILTGVVLLFLVNKYVLRKQGSKESFDSMVQESSKNEGEESDDPSQCQGGPSDDTPDEVQNSEPLGHNEKYASSEMEVAADDTMANNKYPTDCFPKDKLTPSDLLPADSDSTWAKVNPTGQGKLSDKNFLDAGFHVGINTVGQTLRNANLQIRSEPANPQVKVSPWLQSTIAPDTNRKPMEIGSCE